VDSAAAGGAQILMAASSPADSRTANRQRVLQDLIALLDLETLEENLFRGVSRDLGGKSVFGGQVIGQALVAAARTVQGRVPHSLHAYFLRPGDMHKAIVYEVDRVRDGHSFSARRVQAIQHGAAILTMIVSFQKPESGDEHQQPMPQVPPPEALCPLHVLNADWLQDYEARHGPAPERLREALLRELAIEFRPVEPWNPLEAPPAAPRQCIWFRAAGRLPDDPMLHCCVLAYASDFNLLSTALRPHGFSYLQRSAAVASIDHALWFHRAARTDDWLLYAMDSPSAQGARGLSRGLIYDRSGRLVTSVAQESLMRHLGDA
jgi:acyl-CoA thioesterase-2